MTNKKRKGFTIVELVIVIAVIAILAGVLIPTFASIIDKANQSSDIQAVRQMNVLLKAESVEDKPTDVNKVIKIVSEAGYDTVEKRTPKSKDHGFYWHAAENIILLAKDKEGETPVLVYPLDNETLSEYFSTESVGELTSEKGFYTLEVEGGGTPATPTTPTGTKIEDLEDLIAALKNENGENYYFAPENGNEIVVDQTITDTATTNVTIDLNGYTLTLGADASLTINGNVTFTDSKRSNSTTALESKGENKSSCIIIEDDDAYYNWESEEGKYDDGFWYVSTIPGFKVVSSGSLTISNLEIQGNRFCNIDNEGAVSLNTVNDFNVTAAPIWDGEEIMSCYGYGIYNNKTGTVSINNVSFNINTASLLVYVHDECYGIYNKGSLNVGTIGENSSSTFTVNGGAYGILNYGPATINNTSFCVNEGCSFYNSYSSTSENDKVTITGGSFTAVGSDNELSVTSIYNKGTMIIDGTDFDEKLTIDENGETCGIMNYENDSPIYAYDGELTLKNDVSINADYVVYASAGSVIIKGGEYNGKFSCGFSATIIITEGTFKDESLNNKSLNTLDAKVFYDEFCNTSFSNNIIAIEGESVKISGGKIDFNNSGSPVSISNASMYLSMLDGIQFGAEVTITEELTIYNGDKMAIQSLAKLSTDGDGKVISDAKTIDKYLENAINGELSKNGSILNIKLVEYANSEIITTFSTKNASTTITLGKDLTLKNITVKGSKIINLNGKILTLESSDDKPAITLNEGHSLTINGPSKDNLGEVKLKVRGSDCVVVKSGGILNFTNTNIVANSNNSILHAIQSYGNINLTYCSYRYDVAASICKIDMLGGGTLTINPELTNIKLTNKAIIEVNYDGTYKE